MSVDLTEPSIGKKKALHSELFTKDLFKERNLLSKHKDAKIHHEVQYLNCL